MKSIKMALPSFVTSLALLAGCISITYSSLDNVTIAAYFIIAAAILDFLDGFLARSLKAITPFGKQFDSLADVINFGLAPAMIMYRLIYRAIVDMEPTSQFNIVTPGFTYYVLLNCSFMIALFAAIRLAKYNIDEEQAKSFKGLPSPSNAIFILSIGLVSENYIHFPGYSLTSNIWFLLTVTLALSYLMVSDFKMFSLKFGNYGLKGNMVRYIFLLLSIVILIIWHVPGLALIVILYIVLSFLNNLIKQSGKM